MTQNNLDITWKTIFKIFFAILCFYLLFLARDVLVWLLFAFIISLLFNPFINFLNRMKIPRTISAIFAYLSVFGLLGLVIYLSAPLFTQEIQQFFQLLPIYFEKILPLIKGLGVGAFDNIGSFREALQGILEQASTNILGALSVIFGGIFRTIFTLSMAFFLSLDEERVRKNFALFFPKQQEHFVINTFKRVQKKVSGWFGGAIISASFVGVATFITLLLFDVKYAGIFGLLAGILGFIPILGPTLIAILAFSIVALDSLPKAIFVLGAFILIQQIEGNIVTPMVAKKFVGIPPFVVIASVAIGGILLGIPGAILAIPLAGIILEFLGEYLRMKRENVKVMSNE